LFLGGMLALWVGADWPIHDWAERYLYSMHMVQHMLFTLVAAPLLVAGIPAWLWRDVLRTPTVRRLWRFATRPLVAIVLFYTILLFSHWPAVVTFSVHSEPGHFALHCLILLSAGHVVADRLPAAGDAPISPPGQMPSVRGRCADRAGGVPRVPARAAGTVYATFPRIWGSRR
jgi:putative membrane protein